MLCCRRESSTSEISVDDPNFWEKVIPGVITIEMLKLKLEDGSAFQSESSKQEFLSNLEDAVKKKVMEIKKGTGLKKIHKQLTNIYQQKVKLLKNMIWL